MKPLHSTIMLLATVASLGLAMCAPVATATPPDNPNKFTVGTLHVKVHGDHGPPLILIPGLGSGPWVWQATIDNFDDDHRIYALTLAGFNGTEPPEKSTQLMAQARQSLLKLIQEHDIDQPVLIGHSLGGTLALALAERHSDLIAGVLAADGLPIFPGFERLTKAQREARAAHMQQLIAGVTPAQFRQQQITYMQTKGVIDPDMAAKYGAMQARSDQATVAQFMYEDLTTDLRAQLDQISVPVLVISPYYKPDFEAAAASGLMPMMSAADKADLYRKLMQGTPNLDVVSITPARHFVMLDQPEEFQRVVADFLQQLAPASNADQQSAKPEQRSPGT